MKKRYPCYLPGKELWGPHFHCEDAAKLDSDTLRKEIQPLWDHAIKKGWIDAKIAQELHERVVVKQTDAAWQQAQNWATRLNWHQSQESKAAAGWLILKNLNRARLRWISFRRPYNGLRPPTLEAIEDAIKISNPFEVFLAEEYRERERHILAGMVLLTPKLDVKAIGRDMIGVAAIEAAHDPFLSRLAVSHGAPNPHAPGGWSKPSMERVRGLAAKLEKDLPPAHKDWIEQLRKIPV